jgi:hypothetical protein
MLRWFQSLLVPHCRSCAATDDLLYIGRRFWSDLCLCRHCQHRLFAVRRFLV